MSDQIYIVVLVFVRPNSSYVRPKLKVIGQMSCQVKYLFAALITAKHVWFIVHCFSFHTGHFGDPGRWRAELRGKGIQAWGNLLRKMPARAICENKLFSNKPHNLRVMQGILHINAFSVIKKKLQ
jgi:hypothetical protein